MEVSFKTELKTQSGSFYTPLDACFNACALSSSISGGIVTYVPYSLPISANYLGAGESCTIVVVKDGLQHTVKGAVGTFKIMAEAGKIPEVDFSYKGLYTAVSDVTTPSVSVNTTLPIRVASSSLTIQGYSPIASKIEIDCGNTITEIDDVNSVYGIYGYQITGRKPKGSFDPVATTVATHDFLGRMVAGTEAAGNITIGTGSGQTIVITTPAVQYTNADLNAKGDYLTFQIPINFNMSGSSGTDSWFKMVMS